MVLMEASSHLKNNVTAFAYISSNSNQITQQHSQKPPAVCHALLGEQTMEETKEGGLMARRDGTSRTTSENALVNKRSLTMCTAKKRLVV